VENDAEATFNIDDIGTEDDIDGLDATDTVKVLMKKTSDDVVYPASFSMSLNLSGHNIVAGTMTKKD
jgi:hypothetical protein